MMTSSTEVLSCGSLHDNSDGIRTPVRSNKSRSVGSPGVLNKDISEDVQDEINQMLDSIPQIDKVFKIINKIGSGTFSSVYAAKLKKCPDANKLFALKHIIPTSHPSRIESELRCLYEIGGVSNVMAVQACFRERDHVVIVMPYFAHERFQDYVQLLSVSEVQDYMRNLLIALRRVHEVDIIHRDIKPSNFLFNRDAKKYCLVDFGLAQKAPVPLKKKTEIGEVNMCEVKPVSSIGKKVRKPSASDQVMSSPRKRKISQSDVENQTRSPCKRRAVSESAQNTSAGLTVIDINKQDNVTTKLAADVQPSKPANIQMDVPAISTSMHSAIVPKTTKSPRRMLLTKRVLHEAKKQQDKSKVTAPPNLLKKQPVVVLQHAGRSMYAAVNMSSCACYGKPMICSICMARGSQHAPRAGTPGFRAPEVLMKCPDQTTALDIWSAGVIYLSLLSGRYPFFKAPDDMTALAQIICIVGSEEMKAAALKFGKHLLCSPKTSAIDLEILCKKLRKSTHPVSLLRLRGDAKYEKLISDWEKVPSSAFDLLKRLLDPNPHTRITAEQALNHKFFSENLADL